MDIKNYSLFPTLVSYTSNFLNIDQCKNIIKYVKESSLSTKFTKQASITGNSKSLSTYFYSTHLNVTTDIEQNVQDCKNLKSSILKCSVKYGKDAGFEINNHIKNSWLNIQQPGSILKDHIHRNSIISGVIFLNTDHKTSSLYFHNPNPYLYYSSLKKGHSTQYSFEWYSFTPARGDMILFPGWLRHGSNQIKNKVKNRMILSFNI